MHFLSSTRIIGFLVIMQPMRRDATIGFLVIMWYTCDAMRCDASKSYNVALIIFAKLEGTRKKLRAILMLWPYFGP